MNEFKFEKDKDKEEKIVKFLDNLAWYFSRERAQNHQDLTALAITKLKEKIELLNETIENANKSSEDLAKALNRLTFWGVFIAAVGVFVSLIQFLYNNHIWPFSQ
jgi:predicted RNase H-like nuclease (RuvC/YqgF family)